MPLTIFGSVRDGNEVAALAVKNIKQAAMQPTNRLIIIKCMVNLCCVFYPTDPSKLTCNNFCASTANSIGSLSITSLA